MVMIRTHESKKTDILFLWIAVFLSVMLFTVGYGADALLPLAHDSFHDARHAAGFACH